MKTFTVQATDTEGIVGIRPLYLWYGTISGGEGAYPLEGQSSLAIESPFSFDLDEILAKLQLYWDNPYYGPSYVGRLGAVVEFSDGTSGTVNGQPFVPEDGVVYEWPMDGGSPPPEPPSDGKTNLPLILVAIAGVLIVGKNLSKKRKKGAK